MPANDGWPPVTYRQRNAAGKVGWSSRLGRSACLGRGRVRRIEAVFDSNGLVPSSEYSLRPFPNCPQLDDGPPRLWFREPRLTRGLTILFEAA
jgi:hypothetical protein